MITKPRSPRKQRVRREPVRLEVPEVSSAPPKPAPEPAAADPVPEHIRRMLEAAYT